MSDNIYCVYDFVRFSIDTLYLGLKTDDLIGFDVFYKINNYLKDICYIDVCDIGHGNIYYQYCYEDKQNGVFISVCPRENVKNDYITLQLSGKFFRWIVESEKFIDVLFEEFSEFINIQRVDVAIDICYKNYPSHLIQTDSRIGLCGFPVPSYNPGYKYIHNGFEFYGRTGKVFYQEVFVNMIACGKGDTRLRVYDKTLDLMEKYKTEYSLYYDLKEDFEQVYRIEYQCRGKKLKGWIDRYLKKYPRLERKTLVDEIVVYIFNKFCFEYIDNLYLLGEYRKPIRFVPIKRESTLENQYKYHSKMQNAHYKKCCDIADRIVLQRKVSEACKAQNLFFKDKDLTIDLYREFQKNLECYRED